MGRFKVPIVAATAFAVFFSPETAFQSLLMTTVFFAVSSLKFKGHLPSAPFISVSFIYFLAMVGS